ncbi:MAG TPA: tetratricopeptide repeat protein [Vicinamibacterales bacterium]|nr:tetratricopeptide repeat protein [Vicinamibacterales bacterium]
MRTPLMRTTLFRCIVALIAVCAMAAPALAQSVMRGKVTDAQGKPVQDAVVEFASTDSNRKTSTKTDKNGEFLQVGLQSGGYKVTASKQGVGTQTKDASVKQGPNPQLAFTLAPAGAGGGPTDKAEQAAITASANAAIAAMKAGNNDEAIAKFQEVIAKVPTCADCYYNMGLAYANKKDYAQAETAYKKAIELKPDNGEAYTGLATIYNAQKKFDLAADASAKAAQFSGAAGGGGSAEASYNQGVILFNAGKFAEAKTQFDAATKADPNNAMAQYQLGMTCINLGQFPEAVAALEAYLKADPNGAKAAEVKAALPALQQMLKK